MQTNRKLKHDLIFNSLPFGIAAAALSLHSSISIHFSFEINWTGLLRTIRFAHKMGSFVNINQIRRLIQLAPNISMEIWNVEIMVKINSLDHNRNGNTLLALKLEWAFSIRECWFPALYKLIFPFSSHFRRLLAGTSENAPFPTIVQMLCSNKWLFGSQAEVNYRPSDHVCDYYN